MRRCSDTSIVTVTPGAQTAAASGATTVTIVPWKPGTAMVTFSDASIAFAGSMVRVLSDNL